MFSDDGISKMKNNNDKKFIILFFLLFRSSYAEGNLVDIRDQFTEMESGLYFYVDENDSFLQPYQQNGYTVKKYIREKIFPVVKKFLAFNVSGDLDALSDFIGQNSINSFSVNCKLHKVNLANNEEYKKQFIDDMRTRKYTCNINSYFGLYRFFRVKEENIFFFKKKHYFLVWLYPNYIQGKNMQGQIWERSPSFDQLKDGSTFVMYYMKEPAELIARYYFQFDPKLKKYELLNVYPEYTENFIDVHNSLEWR